MHLRAGIFSLPKRGNSVEEYEDAFYPASAEGRIEAPFRCAIADGATETSYSGLWARLLAEGFCSASASDDVVASLPGLRSQWNATTKGKDLPWYAEQKLAKGAYATLLGLAISAGEFPQHLRWDALAVGDSCLFQVRNHEYVASFPASKADDFGSNPLLLSSNAPEDREQELQLFQRKSGILEAGESLYLATDALAAWIFRALDREEKPFLQIDQAIRVQNGFPILIEGLWENHALKNDDCTLFWVEAAGNPA